MRKFSKKDMKGSSLSHLDGRGQARMVDVSKKAITHRRAVAYARVLMQKETLSMIIEGRMPKGDVLATARIAGIMAAKRTSDLLPLCHPLFLTHVSVDIDPISLPENRKDNKAEIEIRAICETKAETGVEMEALTAVSIAALSLYDMCKAVDRAMVVGEVMLLEKEGGASGHWIRTSESKEFQHEG